MITWERRAPHGRQNQGKLYPFFNRGKNRNTRNKFHWKNEAVGEQRTFTSSPDHIFRGIYP